MVAISSNGTSRVSITLPRKNTRFCYSKRSRESTKSEKASKTYRTTYGTRTPRSIIGQFRRYGIRREMSRSPYYKMSFGLSTLEIGDTLGFKAPSDLDK